MSDNRRIAVIDVGKTNAKVVVVDAATGRKSPRAARPIASSKDGPYPHYDVEALWAFFVEP